MKVFIILALALVARAEPPVPQDYSYDMSPPSVNAPSASYGLPNQQFGTPINTNNGLTDATFTGFGDSNNQYDDMPSSEYGAPSMPSNQYLPASRTPSQQYGAPAQQQRTPSQQYGAPTQNRGSSARKPSQQYGAPSSRTPSQQYGAPAQQQRTPSQQYGAPAQQQRTPSQQYGAPAQNRGNSARTPSQQYGAPAQPQRTPSQQYGAPAQQQRTPSQQYGAPAQQQRTPSKQYGAPAQQQRTPSQQYGTPSVRTPANRNAAARMPSQQYGAPSNMPSEEYGAPAFGGYPDSRDNSYDDMSEPASYEYKYEVNDGESGSEFGHKEERDGDSTFGEYRVLLPDGRTQVVAYEADENGYRPTITYLEPENQGYPKSNSGGPY